PPLFPYTTLFRSYVLQDATAVPPADWLVIESRGGRGGPGVTGSKGTDGSPGAAGCPAQPGAPGGNGGSGGPGGSGGRGGRVTVIVPRSEERRVGRGGGWWASG